MEFSAKNVQKPYEFLNEIRIHGTDDVQEDLWTEFNGELVIRNVTTPTLIRLDPHPEIKALGEAVIVAPGGGMLVLAIENEGLNIAKRLTDAGYTAYVLKYSVNATKIDADEFKQECIEFYEGKMANGFGCADSYLDAKSAASDLISAVRKIREFHKTKLVKLHYIGFSAGAKVGIDALSRSGSSNLLDTLGLIYFSLERPDSIASNLPPLFAAIANDDPLFSRSGFGLIEKWQAAGQDIEFHLFKNGGHGFAGRPNGSSSDQWIDLYMNWLKLQR